MKRFIPMSAAILGFSALALAESWTGTVVDVMCKGKDLAGHTARPAPRQPRHGRIVTPDVNSMNERPCRSADAQRMRFIPTRDLESINETVR